MSSDVIDIIEVEVSDLLLKVEDAETRLENFIEVSGGKVGKGLDLHGHTTGKRDGQFGSTAACGRLVGELLADDRIGELAHGNELLGIRRSKRIDTSVVLLHSLSPLLLLLRVVHDSIDDGVGFAKDRALKFLRSGRGRIEVVVGGVHLLATVTYSVDFITLLGVFTTHFSAINIS